MTDAKTIIKDWCAAAGMPEPSDGECHALEVALQQQSGISGELPSAQDREDAHDIEAAAKTLAECMDYPWEPMPEKGREAMRNHAKRVIDAARAAKGADHG